MLFFEVTFTKASSLSLVELPKVKSITFLTCINLSREWIICSIIIFVPEVTIIILEYFFVKLTGATVKLSILYPLPENNPITLA